MAIIEHVPAPHQRRPGFLLLLLLGINIGTIAGAIYCAPVEASAAAIATMVTVSAILRYRFKPILDAADRVTRAFCFNEGLCADELRSLSKAVFLWRQN